MALRRRVESMRPGRWSEHDQVFHLRTPARKEIDFVMRSLGQVAIEAKYTESGRWLGEAATVTAGGFQGILATRAVLDVTDRPPTGAGPWAVPAAFLGYLIDT